MDDTPNPYELVKNRLLETYTPTRWQLARQLLTFPHVSGVRPTTLMNQLLSLLPPGDHPDTMFLMLFLDRLPPNISAQLTARTFRHPRDMAASVPMRIKSETALHRRRSLWRRCRHSRALRRRHLQSPCGQFPARAVAVAALRHPAAGQTTATTIGGLERRLTTARLPVPGLALVRKTAPPPVDSEHCFCRRPAVTPSGRAHWPHLSG